MRNFARKIIDAIQHSLLDRLVVQLIHVGWVCSLWDSREGGDGGSLTGFILIALVAAFVLAWALGALANRRRRPQGRPGTFDGLHESGPNGFSAWSELPQGGLRPPRIIRGIVAILSTGSRSGISALTSLGVGFLGLTLVVALSHKPDAFWAELHPDLARAADREILWFIGTAAVLLMLLRTWASEQRARLEPAATPLPKPRWLGYVSAAVFLVFLGLGAVMMGLPTWIAVTLALILGVVALVPHWRGRALDVVFGKVS